MAKGAMSIADANGATTYFGELPGVGGSSANEACCCCGGGVREPTAKSIN
jgi:hypothetical protein